MSPERSLVAERLVRARRHLIARRVWIFALGWLATLLAWLTVFVAHGRIGVVAAGAYLLASAGVLIALGLLARRRPVVPAMRLAACTVCVAFGVSVGVFGAMIGVPGDVTAFVLLTLYLLSALLFAWGWRAELILLVGTMAPLAVGASRVEFLVAPAELMMALLVGAVLCVAVAEGAARSFRIAFLERESAAEAAASVIASRDAYRDLAENARDFIYTGDLEGRILYVNEAGARVLGRSPTELIGTSVLDFVTDHADNPTSEGLMAGLLAETPPPPLCVQVRTPQGPRWFEVVMTLMRDGRGHPTGIRAMSRDVDERVHAERQLRASEARYRSLVETQHEAIVRWDPKGRVTFANEYWLRTIGLDAANVRDARSLSHVHPDDRQMVAEAREAVGAGRQRRENRVRTVDGWRWFEWEGSPILDATGRVVEYQAVGRDVHERRMAEEALRESEARYRVLVESEHALLSRSTADGVLTFVNDRLCEAMGRSREELLGSNLLEYVHPYDVHLSLGGIEALQAAPHRAPVAEIRVQTASGWRWFEWEAVGRVDANGALMEIESLGRDVTSRRETQNALQTSEARYRGLVESQNDLVFRGDLEGRTLFVNDAYCQMVGVPRESLLGRNFARLVHPDDLESTLEQMRALREPPYRGVLQNRAYDAQGRLRWIEWEGCGIADASGEVVELQGVGRDITERKQAEEALQRTLDELQSSRAQLRALAERQVTIREQERKRLGLDLHDDVCQELVGIGILTESIRRRLGPISAEQSRDFDRIGGYLSQLVDHLRLLARELQPLQLLDLGLEGGLRSLARGFSSEACTVDSLFPTAIPRLAEDAEVGVYRIAQEALTNAMRHADADNVRIMLAVVGETLRLEVSDDGRGFDPEARTNALGLVSMEERALSLGGRLGIWSTEGGGTTVRLECPLGDRAVSAA